MNINTINGINRLMCHKKRNTDSTTSRNNTYICGNLTSEEELHMLTEKEMNDDKTKIDNKQVESSAQKPMPSIWYN